MKRKWIESDQAGRFQRARAMPVLERLPTRFALELVPPFWDGPATENGLPVAQRTVTRRTDEKGWGRCRLRGHDDARWRLMWHSAARLSDRGAVGISRRSDDRETIAPSCPIVLL